MVPATPALLLLLPAVLGAPGVRREVSSLVPGSLSDCMAQKRASGMTDHDQIKEMCKASESGGAKNEASSSGGKAEHAHDAHTKSGKAEHAHDAHTENSFVASGTAPEVMLLGPAKAATESVFDLLTKNGVCGSSRPDCKNEAYCAPYDSKESHLFDMDWESSSSENWWAGLKGTALISAYEGSFRGPGSCQKYIDATPTYLSFADVPERMVQNMPSTWVATVKMVAMLREPIDRDRSFANDARGLWHSGSAISVLYSRIFSSSGAIGQTLAGDDAMKLMLCQLPGAYATKVSASVDEITYDSATQCFLDHWKQNCHGRYSNCANYVTKDARNKAGSHELPNRLAEGVYAPQLRAFAKAFSRKQVLVVNFHELLADTESVMNSIIGFYGLSKSGGLGKLPEKDHSALWGKSYVPLGPPSCHMRDQLNKAIFTEANAELATFLKRGDKPVEERDWNGFPESPCAKSS